MRKYILACALVAVSIGYANIGLPGVFGPHLATSGSTFSTLIDDHFTRGNETPIASPWLVVNTATNCNNGSDTIRLASNKFGGVTGHDCAYYFTGISPLANQWMRVVVIGASGSAYTGPACRYNTTSGYYYAVVYDGGSTAYLMTIQSDGKHDLDNFAVTGVANGTLEIQCTGTNPVHLVVIYNGIQAGTKDDPASTRLQSGGLGIYSFDGGSGSLGQMGDDATGGSL